MATIGFIGLGLMGTPMTQRLLAAGHTVYVWNRSEGKSAALEAQGACRCTSIAELVGLSSTVMLCVSNTDAVRQVVFGSNGVSLAGSSDKILVDFSSIDPAATRTMAAELHQACGMSWVDAPVSGGVAGAEQGTLAIMAGGETEHIEQIRPLLAPLCQRLTHMGPTGSGQTTKICNQMLVSCYVLVMAEVMAMAEKAGVDAAMIPAAVKGGFADSIPLQLTGPRMAERDFAEVKWHVKTLLKDLDMANDLARSLGSAVPMAGLGVELMRQHASRGYADQDPATLIDLYTEKPGEA